MSEVLQNRRSVIHPYKFNMWLGIVAMVMMFAAFTSAYVVKKADVSNWLVFDLPVMFNYSAVVIVLSSIAMQLAYFTFRRNKIGMHRIFIVLTFLLGAAFLVLQVMGWQELKSEGILLKGNVAGSFLYVISGAHFLHVVGGVIALLVFVFLAFTRYNRPEDTLLENIHPERQIGVELMATYWHFVDVLWLYLFFFFQMS
jgi:cytochrome c oxidase subunit 3